MIEFQSRALEIHSDYAMDFDWVRKAISFIADHGMTALVLHQNDIVDRVTYPPMLGSSDKFINIHDRYSSIYPDLYRIAARERGMSINRRDYLSRVVDIAARKGIQVWLENKELWFHDSFVELHPQVFKGGPLCPNEPIWTNFVRTKYENLFSDVSGIAGIITAPATRESRLSISGHRCTCELCRNSPAEDWYRRLLMAMHGPITAAGGTLVVRDFVFDHKTQSEIARVMNGLPEDVIICLKNTPHDFYPTFPDNPRIGNVGPHRQWIEVDTMGQYFGWGIAPSHMVDDIRRRFAHADKNGVEGVLIRTDWEGLEAHSAFHTPNLLNLYAVAALSINRATPKTTIYREWLEGERYLKPGATEAEIEDAVEWTIALWGDSWEIVRRALYTNDCVFSDSSCYPVSLSHAWWLAEEKNSLRDWDPSKEHAMDADEPNVRRIIDEKEEALTRVEALAERVVAMPTGLTEAAHRDFVCRVDVFRRYIRGFREIGQACILTKHLTETETPSSFLLVAKRLLDERLQGLLDLAAEFRAYRQVTDFRHTTYAALGAERLEILHADLTCLIAKRESPARDTPDPELGG